MLGLTSGKADRLALAYMSATSGLSLCISYLPSTVVQSTVHTPAFQALAQALLHTMGTSGLRPPCRGRCAALCRGGSG